MPFVFEKEEDIKKPRFVFEEKKPEAQKAPMELAAAGPVPMLPQPDLGQLSDILEGVPGTMGSLAVGMAAWPVGLLAKYITMMSEASKGIEEDIRASAEGRYQPTPDRFKRGLEKGKAVEESVMSIPGMFAIQPGEQAVMGTVAKPFEYLEKGLRAAASPLPETLQEPVVDLGTLLTLAAVPKAAKGIKKRVGLKKTPEQLAKTPESKFLQKEFKERFVFEKEKPEVTKRAEKIRGDQEVTEGGAPGYAAKRIEDKGIEDIQRYPKGRREADVTELSQKEKAQVPKKLTEKDVPVFETAKETVEFAKQLKPEQIEQVRQMGIKSLEKVKSLKREGKLQQAIDETRITQNHREIIEAYQGKLKEKPPERPLMEREGQKKPVAKPEMSVPKDKSKGPSLYSGIPVPEMSKLGNIWTKNIGEPIWDKLIMQKIPKMLEKVPGGKSVNRAAIYEYRGDLPNAEQFIKKLDDYRRYNSIGREYAIDLGRRLQAATEKSQLRMGEAIRGELKIKDLKPSEKRLVGEAKRALYTLGKQAVDAGLLAGKTFFKHAGRYMPRLYTTKEYQTLLTRYNLTKPNRLDLSRFKRRKDIPKEIRQQMGEILTPGYPVAKGITQLTHDIELAKFFNGIAKNPDWAVIKQPKISKKTGKPVRYKTTTYHPLTGKKIEHFGIKKEFVDKIPEGWKKLPQNKKLGALSEAYVHPEIFKDLQEAIRVMETPERVWRKTLGYWKFGKVIISPKTHARNLMSNSVLAHLGGLPMYEQPVYLVKSARALKKKGMLWKKAREEGLLTDTFTNAELRTLFDQVEGAMTGIKAGSIPEAMGVIGRAWEKTKTAGRGAAKLYELEEQWFKMAKFIHNVERRKMGYATAAKDAEKWLFNYRKVTKFQEKYRTKWYGAPFATFTFKALPRIMEAAVKYPWRFALPTAIIYALEREAMDLIGDTKEQYEAKRELRPEYMQKGKFFGVIPNWARVPFIDEHGREHYLNLTYILPWGDIAEGGEFMGIPGSLRPMSQPFVSELAQQIAGYDFFFKSEIVPEKELAGKTTTQKMAKEAELRLKHLGRSLAPTPAIDITKGISALRGKPDYRGRLRAPEVVALDTFAGIKLYPVDYVDELQKQIAKADPKKGYIAKKIKSQIKTYSIQRKAMEEAGKSTEFYDKLIDAKIKQLQGMAKDVKEIGEAAKKAKLR